MISEIKYLLKTSWRSFFCSAFTSSERERVQGRLVRLGWALVELVKSDERSTCASERRDKLSDDEVGTITIDEFDRPKAV